MSGPTPRNGDDHDPWLAAALRHAPDAADAPPAALSEAILRAAHDASAATPVPRPGRSSPHALLQFWSWLTQPAVATAFTTLVLATAIGVMWWDEAVEPELTRPTPPPRGAVTSAVPAAPPPAAEPATAPPAAAPQGAPPQAAPTAAAPKQETAKDSARAPQLRSRSAAEAADDAAKAEDRPARTVGRAAPSSEAPAGEQASSIDEARESADQALQRAIPAPSATPGLAAQAPTARPRQQVESTAPAAKDATPGRASIDTRSDAAAGIAPSAPAATAPLPARRAETAAAPSAPAGVVGEPSALFADVRNRPQRWRWQADGRAVRTIDEPFLRWWAELERAAPAWSAQPPGAGSAGAAPPLVLRAVDDASVAVTIRLEADGTAQATFAGGATWRTTLGRADAAALREALERLAR